ncbi:MAG: hypothetical protein LBL67_00465 [Coriobacteriales bacterium]|jgi:uncharacterized membrane protein|nr:hypothetical protein [Coriobacteriales bacterium]
MPDSYSPQHATPPLQAAIYADPAHVDAAALGSAPDAAKAAYRQGISRTVDSSVVAPTNQPAAAEPAPTSSSNPLDYNPAVSSAIPDLPANPLSLNPAGHLNPDLSTSHLTNPNNHSHLQDDMAGTGFSTVRATSSPAGAFPGQTGGAPPSPAQNPLTAPATATPRPASHPNRPSPIEEIIEIDADAASAWQQQYSAPPADPQIPANTPPYQEQYPQPAFQDSSIDAPAQNPALQLINVDTGLSQSPADSYGQLPNQGSFTPTYSPEPAQQAPTASRPARAQAISEPPGQAQTATAPNTYRAQDPGHSQGEPGPGNNPDRIGAPGPTYPEPTTNATAYPGAQAGYPVDAVPTPTGATTANPMYTYAENAATQAEAEYLNQRFEQAASKYLLPPAHISTPIPPQADDLSHIRLVDAEEQLPEPTITSPAQITLLPINDLRLPYPDPEPMIHPATNAAWAPGYSAAPEPPLDLPPVAPNTSYRPTSIRPGQVEVRFYPRPEPALDDQTTGPRQTVPSPQSQPAYDPARANPAQALQQGAGTSAPQAPQTRPLEQASGQVAAAALASRRRYSNPSYIAPPRVEPEPTTTAAAQATNSTTVAHLEAPAPTPYTESVQPYLQTRSPNVPLVQVPVAAPYQTPTVGQQATAAPHAVTDLENADQASEAPTRYFSAPVQAAPNASMQAEASAPSAPLTLTESRSWRMPTTKPSMWNDLKQNLEQKRNRPRRPSANSQSAGKPGLGNRVKVAWAKLPWVKRKQTMTRKPAKAPEPRERGWLGFLHRYRQVRSEQEHRGYIKITYFNLFWIFVICSIIGLLIEQLYCWLVFGWTASRAGLVWGPFSPIYGLGAVLFTCLLNRLWDKNVIIIFAVSGITGMAFEWLCGFLLQSAFGVVSWDYTGKWGNIGGHTDIAFGIAWGILGVLWIRLLLPIVLRLIALIPKRVRIGITAIASILLLIDVVMTITAGWYYHQRLEGNPVNTPMERNMQSLFPDQFMASRFGNAQVS